MPVQLICNRFAANIIFLIFFLYSTDETSTENVLKSLQTFASVSGRVGLTTPRDAFITALCKASLPPHYNLSILSSAPAGLTSNRGISKQK